MSNDAQRRAFFKLATAGVAGTALVTLTDRAFAQTPGAPKTFIYDVTTFGAKGNGTTLDTPAINKAIETASANGGGMVVIPPGVYLCYSIHLKSNVELHLSQGSTILAAPSPLEPSTSAYDIAEPRQPWEDYQDYGHNHWHNSLIWGEGIENFSITGPGLIWGKGLSTGRSKDGPPIAEVQGVANKAIALKNCRNVIMRDFSILAGGHFAILATGVDNWTLDNVTMDTNRDGVDIDCCHNVRVSNCAVNSPWDDAICPKSSYALGYARPTDMLTITNCLVTGQFEMGTLLNATYKRFPADAKVPRNGRIKLGTEANGGFQNITISNCVFDGCRGLALETVDGALLEDITITNITMRGLLDCPIFLRLGARMRGPAGVPVGVLRRVIISNIVASGAGSKVSSLISGIPGHQIEDVKISNVIVQHEGGGTKEMAALKLAENEQRYPEPSMFGPTPSHGFYLRHVKGIEMSDIKIESVKGDARPAFVLDDVQQADFFHIKTPKVAGVPTFALNNVEDFSVERSRPLSDTQLDKVTAKEI
jgi:polygalacturonase